MKWAIPKSFYDDPEKLAKAQLVVKYSYVTIAINAGFPPLMYFIFGQLVPAVVVTILVGLLMIAPLSLRITHSIRFAGHLFIFFTVSLISVTSILYGGFVAPPIPFLLVGPMAAVFLLGARSGVAWAIIVCAMVSVGVGLEALGVEYPNYNTPGQELFLRYAGIFFMIAVAMVFILQFDSLTKQALNEVRVANRRIGQMIKHVEATSSALSRSAAEFLGDESKRNLPSEATRESGLTQQMMQTATNGREVIFDVGESLLGMIAQYRSISQRIQDLHQQSSMIAELVKTIDKISDRLDLMALNTGIEAVHAGESGKRFRLLSDDMRRLAERVSTETKRIKAVLQQVKEHTDVALEASVRGQSLTDDGTSKLEGMSTAFDEMYQLIERTAQASKRMTEDTRNQITAIRNLARAGEAIS